MDQVHNKPSLGDPLFMNIKLSHDSTSVGETDTNENKQYTVFTFLNIYTCVFINVQHSYMCFYKCSTFINKILHLGLFTIKCKTIFNPFSATWPSLVTLYTHCILEYMAMKDLTQTTLVSQILNPPPPMKLCFSKYIYIFSFNYLLFTCSLVLYMQYVRSS